MREDRTIFHSNDTWLIGVPPEIFRNRFPTTAREITKSVFQKLKKNNKPCIARMCLDRYNCLRFNRDLEKDSRGALNTIPAKWKKGSERCRDFIDIEKVYINTNDNKNQ